mgnify:CR=1 FL=1
MQIYDWVSIGVLFVLGILFYFRPAWLLGEDRQQADGKVRTVSAAAVVCAMVMTVICVIG